MSIPQGHTDDANRGHISAGQQARTTYNHASSGPSGGPSLPPLTPLSILKRAGRDARLTGAAPRLMIELYTDTNAWQTLDVTALADTLACGTETIQRAVRKLRGLRYLEERPSRNLAKGRDVRFNLDPTPGGHSR